MWGSAVRLFAKLMCVGLVGSAALIPVVGGSSAQAQTQAQAQAQTQAQAQARDAFMPTAMVALVDVMARRVEIADTVAAAKWGTSQPIDDPAREKTVVDNAAAQASAHGVEPSLAVRVFSDQIAANKVVQYGLYSRWTAYPGQAPTERPDLGAVRPVLDSITGQLLTQVQATAATRTSGNCHRQFTFAQMQVARNHHFDQLHWEALNRAGAAMCD